MQWKFHVLITFRPSNIPTNFKDRGDLGHERYMCVLGKDAVWFVDVRGVWVQARAYVITCLPAMRYEGVKITRLVASVSNAPSSSWSVWTRLKGVEHLPKSGQQLRQMHSSYEVRIHMEINHLQSNLIHAFMSLSWPRRCHAGDF